MKRTVTIVSCNGMTVSDGDGTLASTIDSLKYAATLRIDFNNISVPVIVMRHGNCRKDTLYIWTKIKLNKFSAKFNDGNCSELFAAPEQADLVDWSIISKYT